MKVPLFLQQAARCAVDSLMADLVGVRAVVIATEDGFELAGRMDDSAQIARLSAVASSLSALGVLAGEENHLGACDNVTVQAQHGHLVMVQVRHPVADLILSVTTNREAILGQVLYRTKMEARRLLMT